MWIFWSKEDDDPQTISSSSAPSLFQSDKKKEIIMHKTPTQQSNIRENIKYWLLSTGASDISWADNFLVQLWVPTTSSIQGRTVLKTSNQPFDLKRIARGPCEYIRHCMSLEFSTAIQDEEEDDEFGYGGESVIGRVFRNKQMECTPNVEYYTSKEYPHLEFAIKCGIQTSLALPLFQPNSCESAGVLEIVKWGSGSNYSYPNIIAENISQMAEDTEVIVLQEIRDALEVVCRKHRLPSAQIWHPCQPTSCIDYVDDYTNSCSNSYLACINKFHYIVPTGDLGYLDRINSIKDLHVKLSRYKISNEQRT